MVFKIIIRLLACHFLMACSGNTDITQQKNEEADIFPDYKNVVIPPNMAPLHFRVNNHRESACFARVECNGELFTVEGKKGEIKMGEKRWRHLLKKAAGSEIKVTVAYKENNAAIAYQPFTISVSTDSIDSYLVYRLIEPGYELWNQMGIYQRELESFKQTPVIENKLTGGNCMNCHSFNGQDPSHMLFHMRGAYAGTYLLRGDSPEKLNANLKGKISGLVYPAWHPSGRYVAFSVNRTDQGVHVSDPNRVEVFDYASDVVVYDVEKHEIVTTPLLFSPAEFETFPTFSPDGRTLYFCSADSCTMPGEFRDVRYSLCAVSFDPENRLFGETVDTLYHAAEEGKSASFPRVSPDGSRILFTLGDYGGFFVWHKEADLYMLDPVAHDYYPLEAANSEDAESYHSWSSNGRWIVFSSRRIDGLYTRPFICHINEQGEASKAFVLPQKDTDFYGFQMKSYNVPEFSTHKVPVSGYTIAKKAKSGQGTDLTFLK